MLLALLLFTYVPLSGSDISSSAEHVRGGLVRTRTRIGNWRLTTETSRFNGAVRCRAVTANGRLVYRDDGVLTRLPGHPDPNEIWLRIDGGSAIRWRDLLSKLARADLPVTRAELVRPLSGTLWLPAEQLLNARQLAIAFAPGARPRHFNLAGLDTLMVAARELGCGPAGRSGA